MCVLPSGSVGRDPTDGADLNGAAPAHGVTAMAGSRMAGSARHSTTGTTTGGRLELATPHKILSEAYQSWCGRIRPSVREALEARAGLADRMQHMSNLGRDQRA